jgi:hypothetical protein
LIPDRKIARALVVWRTQTTSTSGPAERSRARRAPGSPWRTSCSAGLTVTELVVATGRQKTWVYDRLGELQQAALVERAGQGRYRRCRPPTGGWEAAVS